MDAIQKSSLSSVDKIGRAKPEDLLGFTNDSRELAEKLIEGAKEYIAALKEMEETREDKETESKDQEETSEESEDQESPEREPES